ncbi:MAG: hypothetical protein AB8H86_26125 [Polyangiales bacterium]
MRRALILLLGAVVSCFPESFSISDAGPPDVGSDIPLPDAGPIADTGPERDVVEPLDAQPDAAPSNRVEVECATPWSDLGPEPTADCAGRNVSVVGEGIGPNAVDIALLESQEVALAWNSNELFDSGGIELRVLNTDTLEPTRTAAIAPEAVLGELAGRSISLVPEGEDVHIAYWVERDGGSTIDYRRWSGTLSAAETISAVGRSGDVSLGVSERGDATFAVYDQVSGRYFARTRLNSGELEASVPLGEDMVQVALESRGISLVHLNGVSHLASRRRLGEVRAQLRYRRRTSLDSWSGATAIASPRGERNSGLAVDIAAFGDQVAVVYLDWLSGQVEVRLATWNSTPDDVSVQILATYASEEPPVYTPLDVEYDAFGLIHVLFSDDEGDRDVQYMRQASDGGRWVSDTVVVVTSEASIRARFVVGRARQPHIVFTARGDVHYATIRP